MAKIKKVTYLILGNGFIGNRFHHFLTDSALSSRHFFTTDDIEREIVLYNPDVVINCIGKTGIPNVDWCEDHKLETAMANTVLPMQILEACSHLGKFMVHLSTGCIYEGDNSGRAYSESDEANFNSSYYSRTKLLSQKLLSEYDVLQLRLRMPIDIYPHPRNLIDKLLMYNKIVHTRNSISVIPDFLTISKILIEKRCIGIYNVVNKGAITHEEIIRIYEEASGTKKKFDLISEQDLLHITKAKRSHCVLSVAKLESEGITVPEVKQAVKDCLAQYASYRSRIL